MSKKRSRWSYDVYLRRLSKGRGTGTGSSYQPWITIHDFASKGSVSRILGRKSGRLHHLFSHLESDLFCLFDHSQDIADIREQFPLRLKETLQLSARMNIRHPFLPGCDFPFVMTTDFLLTMDDGSFRAYAVKSSDDLDNKRTVQKLMLEKAFWEQENVRWKIITEKEINRDKAANLRWLYYGDDISCIIPCSLLSICESRFVELYHDRNIPFPYIIDTIEEGFSLPDGSGMALFKHLVRSGTISMNLEHRIDTSEPRKGVTPDA